MRLTGTVHTYPPQYAYSEESGVGIYTFPALSALPCIRHGFSARFGGVSQGAFSSLNLSFTRENERENVLENYRLFCKAADVPVESLVLDNYEHGTNVLRVGKSDCGKGYSRAPLPHCDGLVTNDPEVTLSTGHADCMAFYAVDPEKRCIGLAHAGWRGALGRIGKNLVEKLVSEFGADPVRMIVAVGPSICPGCFEVGEDVALLFTDAYPGLDCRSFDEEKQKPHIDLWAVARRQFEEAGVPAAQIHISGVCTVEDERLFSFRRAKGPTGGMAAYLRLV